MSKKSAHFPTDPRFWQKHTSAEIAEKYGVHRNTVARHRRRNKIPDPPRRGGPGRPVRIQHDKIRLDRTAEWNALKQKCSVNWMHQTMSRMKKALEAQKKKPVRKPKAADDWV